MAELWRLIIHGPAGPSWNMAVDEALLRQAADANAMLTGSEDSPAVRASSCTTSTSPLYPGAVLRIYEWDTPAVSIGYFQPTTVVPAGRPSVRRYTGGGLVDHERDVTYTIALPRCHPIASLSTSESYESIHLGVRDALEAIGIAAEVVPCCDDGDSAACFNKAVKFDLKAGSLKLAGAAQRRSRDAFLHQGSVLLPPQSTPEAAAAINAQLRAALAEHLPRTLGFIAVAAELTPDEVILARGLDATRYSSADWNERR